MNWQRFEIFYQALSMIICYFALMYRINSLIVDEFSRHLFIFMMILLSLLVLFISLSHIDMGDEKNLRAIPFMFQFISFELISEFDFHWSHIFVFLGLFFIEMMIVYKSHTYKVLQFRNEVVEIAESSVENWPINGGEQP